MLLVYILIKTLPPSLLYLGTSLALLPVLVFLIASLILFRTKYKNISPTFKLVKLKYSGDLIVKGSQFFVLQMTSLIIFTSSNMVITQIFGPGEVATYNIAFKYFNYVPMIFTTILNPLWSAYTDAYVKEDFDWIRNAIKKVFRVWVLLSILVLIMIIVADYVYDIWLGSKMKVPFALSAVMGLFTIVSNWNDIFAFFMNGLGKIRLSLYIAIIEGIIYIPLSILFAKNLGFGITGVVFAAIICLLLGTVFAPIQYYKIINKKDVGIWGK